MHRKPPRGSTRSDLTSFSVRGGTSVSLWREKGKGSDLKGRGEFAVVLSLNGREEFKLTPHHQGKRTRRQAGGGGEGGDASSHEKAISMWRNGELDFAELGARPSHCGKRKRRPLSNFCMKSFSFAKGHG